MRPLVTGVEMAELDRRTIAELGVPGRTLMEVAGRHVADVAASMLDPAPRRVVIACGGGNNGGDGFVVARALAAHGYEVGVYLFADRSRLKDEALAALQTLENSGDAPIIPTEDAAALRQFAQACNNTHLVVDALLGTGLHAPVRGIIGDAIQVINAWGGPVLSVDLPSGIDADTGAVHGHAVRAHQTVTFAFAKRGHYLFPGAEYRGRLTVADIGIPRLLAEKLGVAGSILLPEEGPGLLKRRRGDSHKGSYGHLVVVAGSAHCGGAAVLALHGALRTGVGLLSWAVEPATLADAPARPPEVMMRLRNTPDAAAWAETLSHGATALLIGPGLGTAAPAAALLAELLRAAQVPLCLDADALNLIAANPELWRLIRPDCVLTPHPKEMARLTQMSVEDVQRDRFAAAIKLAKSRRCVIVLKGAGTLVADPSGAACLIAAGNPGMATGGTGDVLAGIVAGLLAQHLEPSVAARLGVLLHGTAGDIASQRWGQAGLCASDVVDAMGEVWSTWER